MTDDRTLKSLNQAVAFARGDCEHDWFSEVWSRKGDVVRHVKECRKCGVRVTAFDKGASTHKETGGTIS